MSDKKYAWIGEKILAQEDKLMDALHEQAKARSEGRELPSPPAEQKPVPVDPAAEQAAFATLLKFFADNPEDDTELAALTADEFAEEAFTPPAETNHEES